MENFTRLDGLPESEVPVISIFPEIYGWAGWGG